MHTCARRRRCRAATRTASAPRRWTLRSRPTPPSPAPVRPCSPLPSAGARLAGAMAVCHMHWQVTSLPVCHMQQNAQAQYSRVYCIDIVWVVGLAGAGHAPSRSRTTLQPRPHCQRGSGVGRAWRAWRDRRGGWRTCSSRRRSRCSSSLSRGHLGMVQLCDHCLGGACLSGTLPMLGTRPVA